MKLFEMKYQTPDFTGITPSVLEEEVMEGIREHKDEIKAITDNPAVPDFENTIVALERSGSRLTGAELILGNLEAALGDEQLMDVVARVSPLVSHHSTDILLGSLTE